MKTESLDVDMEQKGSRGSEGPAGDCDTSDDEVMQECDVYLNRMYDPPDFVGDMYVLQYPLRPIYRPYGDQGKLDRVDFKPNARRLRFMYKLNQNDHFEDDGIASDGSSSKQRHVLTSTVVANPSCSYAIAVIHRGRMTVTPVRAVNQLRPDFEHVDRQQEKHIKSSSSRAPAAQFAHDGESGESGPEETALVTFSGEAADAGDKVEVELHSSRSGKGPVVAAPMPEEPWIRLDHYGQQSIEGQDMLAKHVVSAIAIAAEAERSGTETHHPKLQKLEFGSDAAGYLAMMCGQAAPRSREQKAKAKAVEAKDGLSEFTLSRMPVERQVEAILRHLTVVSLKQLRSRLPAKTSASLTDEKLLELLRPCAVFTAGVWVLKSELAGYDLVEACARDMLLLLFGRRQVMSTEDLQKWMNAFRSFPKQLLIDMAKQVANPKEAGSDWHLKQAGDFEFIKRMPHVVAEWDEWWKRRKNEITQTLNKANSAGAVVPVTSAKVGIAQQMSKLHNEVLEALALGARTLPELQRHIQKNNTTVAIREDMLLEVLQKNETDAIQVRNLWMLRRTGDEESDKFREVLQQIFRVRDFVSKTEIGAEYERIHGHRCPLSDFAMRTQLRDVAERSEGDTYVIKGMLNRD